MFILHTIEQYRMFILHTIEKYHVYFAHNTVLLVISESIGGPCHDLSVGIINFVISGLINAWNVSLDSVKVLSCAHISLEIFCYNRLCLKLISGRKIGGKSKQLYVSYKIKSVHFP